MSASEVRTRADDPERPWLGSYPPGVPRDVPVGTETIPELLEQAVKKWARRDALVFSLRPGLERRWTYQELWDDIGHVAAALHARGFVPGDRLALLLPNCPEYVFSYFAALRLGLEVVQISPLYVRDDLSKPLSDSRPKGIVTLDILSHGLESVPESAEIPHRFIARLREDAPLWARPFVNGALRRQGRDPRLPHFPFEPFRRLLRTEGKVPEVALNALEDVAVLQYTGGTTGSPKAAMLTHANLVVNARQVRAWLTGYREGEEVLLALIPFFHVYGMTAALNCALLYGATLVTQPLPPSAELIFEYVRRYRPTIFPGVPPFYADIIHHPRAKEADLRGIRFCVSGSAHLPIEVARRFREITGGEVVEGYGLSETSPVTHINPIGVPPREGSVGLPVPSTYVKIVDPSDPRRVLPAGTDGEIAVKGPQVMKGYLDRPEENQRALVDGWFLTGDIGHLDNEGYTYVVDRKKDLIIVGGFNVYPTEVEELLYQFPGVAEAAVVGVPDARLGEVVKAFLVPKPGAKIRVDELVEFFRDRLAHYKTPREFVLVAALPKTMVGKVLKRELRTAPPPPLPPGTL